MERETLEALDQPTQRLWFYALCDAIELARKGDRDELWWIFREERIKPGSFCWVCDRLGFDPEELRGLLVRRWKEMEFFGRSVSKMCREG
jgi:hypothetical protein